MKHIKVTVAINGLPEFDAFSWEDATREVLARQEWEKVETAHCYYWQENSIYDFDFETKSWKKR